MGGTEKCKNIKRVKDSVFCINTGNTIVQSNKYSTPTYFLKLATRKKGGLKAGLKKYFGQKHCQVRDSNPRDTITVIRT